MAKKEIKAIDVKSVVKITTIFYAIVGLIMAITLVVVPETAPGIGETTQQLGTLSSVLIITISYTIMGAIMALLTSVLYNIIAKRIGGIKIDM